MRLGSEQTPRARDFSENTDFTRRKLRRKKQNQLFSAETVQVQPQSQELVVASPKSGPIRKKIAKVIPNAMLTSTSTTTPVPIANEVQYAEGALNRTEEDSRCKDNNNIFKKMQFKTD